MQGRRGAAHRLPATGATRANPRGRLAGVGHQKATDPVLGELLNQVECSSVVADPESIEAANVRELRHGYDRATKLPARLVEELARVTTLAQEVWQEARAKNQPTRAAVLRPKAGRKLAPV